MGGEATSGEATSGEATSGEAAADERIAGSGVHPAEHDRCDGEQRERGQHAHHEREAQPDRNRARRATPPAGATSARTSSASRPSAGAAGAPNLALVRKTSVSGARSGTERARSRNAVVERLAERARPRHDVAERGGRARRTEAGRVLDRVEGRAAGGDSDRDEVDHDRQLPPHDGVVASRPAPAARARPTIRADRSR